MTPADETSALIAQLWQKNKPIIEQRINTLEQALVATQPLPPEQQTEAISNAHKLAGSLGMYGYPEASAAASQIEHALKNNASTNLSDQLATLKAVLG